LIPTEGFSHNPALPAWEDELIVSGETLNEVG
jgi:hypothetical protein